MIFGSEKDRKSSPAFQDEIVHVPVQKHVQVPMITKVPRTVEVEQAGQLPSHFDMLRCGCLLYALA